MADDEQRPASLVVSFATSGRLRWLTEARRLSKADNYRFPRFILGYFSSASRALVLA